MSTPYKKSFELPPHIIVSNFIVFTDDFAVAVKAAYQATDEVRKSNARSGSAWVEVTDPATGLPVSKSIKWQVRY